MGGVEGCRIDISALKKIHGFCLQVFLLTYINSYFILHIHKALFFSQYLVYRFFFHNIKVGGGKKLKLKLLKKKFLI